MSLELGADPPGLVESLIGLLERTSSLEGVLFELVGIHSSKSWNASRLRFDIDRGRHHLDGALRDTTYSLSGGINMRVPKRTPFRGRLTNGTHGRGSGCMQR